jgi:hypothetical protein
MRSPHAPTVMVRRSSQRSPWLRDGGELVLAMRVKKHKPCILQGLVYIYFFLVNVPIRVDIIIVACADWCYVLRIFCAALTICFSGTISQSVSYRALVMAGSGGCRTRVLVCRTTWTPAKYIAPRTWGRSLGVGMQRCCPARGDTIVARFAPPLRCTSPHTSFDSKEWRRRFV